MHKLYIYNGCILSYHLICFLSLYFKLHFLLKYYAKFQPQGSYDLGSSMRVSIVLFHDAILTDKTLMEEAMS